MAAQPAVAGDSPAREVLVARQPVLDGAMQLLGLELLVDGDGLVMTPCRKLAWTRSRAVTAPGCRWPVSCCSRSPRCRCAPTPSSSRCRPATRRRGLEGALRHLARRGACIALDAVTWSPVLEPLLEAPRRTPRTSVALEPDNGDALELLAVIRR